MRSRVELFQQLRDPGKARGILEEVLPALANGELRLKAIRILDLLHRGDWSIRYALELETSSGEVESREVTALCFCNGRFEKSARRLDSLLADAGEEDSHWSGLTGREESSGLLLFPFPLDPKLPQLLEVATSDCFRSALFLSLGISPAESVEFHFEVLRYVPGSRCQMVFSLSRERVPEIRVLGKVFKDDRGRQLAERMKDVEDVFRGNSSTHLRAVRCLGYLPQWKIVLQEWVEGRTLYDLFHERHWETAAVEGTARSIAVLHSSQIAVSNTHTLEDEMEVVRSAWVRLPDEDQAHYGGLVGAIEAEFDGGSAREPVPLHRDFYDKQVLVSGRETTLIDLDTVARGPAEVDVANFQAHLILRSLQGVLPESNARRLSESFLSAYRNAVGRSLNERLLKALRAATLVRLASKYGLLPEGGDLSRSLLESAGGEVLLVDRELGSVSGRIR